MAPSPSALLLTNGRRAAITARAPRIEPEYPRGPCLTHPLLVETMGAPHPLGPPLVRSRAIRFPAALRGARQPAPSARPPVPRS